MSKIYGLAKKIWLCGCEESNWCGIFLLAVKAVITDEELDLDFVKSECEILVDVPKNFLLTNFPL